MDVKHKVAVVQRPQHSAADVERHNGQGELLPCAASIIKAGGGAIASMSCLYNCNHQASCRIDSKPHFCLLQAAALPHCV
jgi:hypothetical protein